MSIKLEQMMTAALEAQVKRAAIDLISSIFPEDEFQVQDKFDHHTLNGSFLLIGTKILVSIEDESVVIYESGVAVSSVAFGETTFARTLKIAIDLAKNLNIAINSNTPNPKSKWAK